MRRALDWTDYVTALLVAVALFVIYSANGRKIPSYDWSDTQIRRSLTAGPSPQNYSLVPVIADDDEER